jgi:hypothetical protein
MNSDIVYELLNEVLQHLMAAVAAVLPMPRDYSTQTSEKCCILASIVPNLSAPPNNLPAVSIIEKIILQSFQSVT